MGLSHGIKQKRLLDAGTILWRRLEARQKLRQALKELREAVGMYTNYRIPEG